ncbi:protein-disulfide reductase DsbD [soil metagenome]
MTRLFRPGLTALLFLAALWAPCAGAVDENDLLPVDEAYVMTARATAPDRIEVNWKIAGGYYLYKHRFSAQAVGGPATVGALQIPPGDKHHDQFFGDVETYRKSVTATLPVVANGASSVQVKLKYQGCADIGVCYPPQTRTLTIALSAGGGPTAPADGASLLGGSKAPMPGMDPAPATSGGNALSSLAGAPGTVLAAGDALPEDQAFKFEAIANSPAELLVRLTPTPKYYLYRDKTSFRLLDGNGLRLGVPVLPAGKNFHDEHFGDVAVWFDQVEIPVPLFRDDRGARSVQVEASFQGCLTDGICYPPMVRVVTVELPAGAGAVVGAASAAISNSAATAIAPEGAPTGAPTLLAALLLALLGGLILNLMPCVLPVLSFKALGLAQASRSHAHARAHALWYTAGVLTTFAVVGGIVLGLRGAGQALGWGFQLQQPWIVASLALLMFAIGLSLSGVFQFGAGLAGVGQSLTEKSGASGDFFTGVLAVVVASPCTAPFMAGALGYAFTAPFVAAIGVFLALGIGLALPFLLIGFVPALAERLPRPGAWMDTMKMWLAYPMYLTAVWLLWVFGKQRGMDAVALLLIAGVVLALALWWHERQRYVEGAARKALAWVLLAVALGVGFVAVHAPSTAAGVVIAEGKVPFSRDTLASLRAAHTPVFIDMTADWCITCKVNEKAVLDTKEFQALLAKTNTTYMVGDWTNQDPAISAFLDEYHSPGVPLYVVYPADGGPGKRLPQVLTMATMREALETAAAH